MEETKSDICLQVGPTHQKVIKKQILKFIFLYYSSSVHLSVTRGYISQKVATNNVLLVDELNRLVQNTDLFENKMTEWVNESFTHRIHSQHSFTKESLKHSLSRFVQNTDSFRY